MTFLPILQRQLTVFAIALGFWLALILLDTSLGLSGTFSGILYWLSLIVLYMAIWFRNLPLVKGVHNDWIRFLGLFVLTTLIITVFMGIGLLVGIKFKTLIGG